MSTATIPLSPHDEKLVNYLLNDRVVASTKADVFRFALRKLAEEEAIASVMESEQDITEGKVFKGDIDDLAKKFAI